jgi:hypothetical protein
MFDSFLKHLNQFQSGHRNHRNDIEPCLCFPVQPLQSLGVEPHGSPGIQDNNFHLILPRQWSGGNDGSEASFLFGL